MAAAAPHVKSATTLDSQAGVLHPTVPAQPASESCGDTGIGVFWGGHDVHGGGVEGWGAIGGVGGVGEGDTVRKEGCMRGIGGDL